jgi:hypothetical protein
VPLSLAIVIFPNSLFYAGFVVFPDSITYTPSWAFFGLSFIIATTLLIGFAASIMAYFRFVWNDDRSVTDGRNSELN